jgi:hypothetical protein
MCATVYKQRWRRQVLHSLQEDTAVGTNIDRINNKMGPGSPGSLPQRAMPPRPDNRPGSCTHRSIAVAPKGPSQRGDKTARSGAGS